MINKDNVFALDTMLNMYLGVLKSAQELYAENSEGYKDLSNLAKQIRDVFERELEEVAAEEHAKL
jgi:hypothetical protein